MLDEYSTGMVVPVILLVWYGTGIMVLWYLLVPDNIMVWFLVPCITSCCNYYLLLPVVLLQVLWYSMVLPSCCLMPACCSIMCPCVLISNCFDASIHCMQKCSFQARLSLPHYNSAGRPFEETILKLYYYYIYR